MSIVIDFNTQSIAGANAPSTDASPLDVSVGANESCLSATDPSRDSTQSRVCRAYSSYIRDTDCTENSFYATHRTPSREFITEDASCAGLPAPRYFMKCYRSDYFEGLKTPEEILERKWVCCRGIKPVKDCDPNYCPSAKSNCLAVYAEYCSAGDHISEEKCKELFRQNPDIYREIASRYCLGPGNDDGKRFKTEICREFCKGGGCSTKLESFCKDKSPVDEDWKRVCGCYYDKKVYDQFRTSIEEKWYLPPGSFGGARICYYPDCKDAFPEYRENLGTGQTCPATSITTCIQDIKVDARGAVISRGTIVPTQIQQCGSAFRQREDTIRCSSDKECENVTGKNKCTGGFCTASSSAKSCKVDEDCPGQQCKGEICIDKPSPSPAGKFPVWAIIAIVAGVLLLLFSIVFWALRSNKSSKPKPTTNGKSTKKSPT